MGDVIGFAFPELGSRTLADVFHTLPFRPLEDLTNHGRPKSRICPAITVSTFRFKFLPLQLKFSSLRSLQPSQVRHHTITKTILTSFILNLYDEIPTPLPHVSHALRLNHCQFPFSRKKDGIPQLC